MFENSKWIGMENCEIASWRGTDISDEDSDISLSLKNIDRLIDEISSEE